MIRQIAFGIGELVTYFERGPLIHVHRDCVVLPAQQ